MTLKKAAAKPKSKPKPKIKTAGKKPGKKKIFDWLKAIVIAIVILLLIRTFVGQSMMISNSKMEKSLLTGDHIFINKLKYGARLPITILAIPFFENSFYLDWIQLPYLKIPGFSEIKQNDIIAFNYPYENDVPIDYKTTYVKRCVAIPGDSIRIYSKKIFVNNQLYQEDSSAIQYRHRVVVKKEKNPDKNFWKKYDISEGGLITKQVYDFNISLKNASLIEKDSMITDIRALKLDLTQASRIYFPNDVEHFFWNIDYFGPVKVPKAKDTIRINCNNIALYKRIIETYEKNKLEIENKKILINDVESDTYVIKQNYYFVMDDNRDDSKDSRHWGFVPADHIIGKASFVWFSFDKNNSGFNKIRWSRFFKGL